MRKSDPFEYHALAACIGKDQTRSRLMQVYVENGKAITCDGHKMAIVDDTVGRENGGYSADLFLKRAAFVRDPNLEPFPKWQDLIPRKPGQVFEITVPGWLKRLKKERSRSEQIRLFIQEGSSFDGDSAEFTLYKSPKSLICVNGEFLAVCGGRTVEIEIRSALEPITVRAGDGVELIIMPMRP